MSLGTAVNIMKQTQLNKEESINKDNLTSAHHDHNKSLNSYAFFKVHDKFIGEDLVQDTFTKTWSYLVRGGKIVMVRAFLYNILNNLIVDQYRKQKHKTDSLDTLVENGFEPKDKDEESERLVNFLDGKNAVGFITKLPETYKKIIHMRFIQSMSLKEISLITGQKKNAIAVQIHRGLEKLMVLYDHKFPFIK